MYFATVDRVSEERQLGLDPRCTPRHVFAAHAPDELTNLGVDSRAPNVATRLPPPIELEALAVPADHGFRFHDHEAGAPVRPELRQPHPENPITLPKPWTFHRALQDAELVAKSQVFRDERSTGKQERAEQDDDNAHNAHGCASVRVA
jgi:hypothetical protein